MSSMELQGFCTQVIPFKEQRSKDSVQQFVVKFSGYSFTQAVHLPQYENSSKADSERINRITIQLLNIITKHMIYFNCIYMEYIIFSYLKYLTL